MTLPEFLEWLDTLDAREHAVAVRGTLALAKCGIAYPVAAEVAKALIDEARARKAQGN